MTVPRRAARCLGCRAADASWAGSVTYEVEHIAFITSDVALTGVRQQYTDAAGSPLEDAAG